MPAGAWGLWLRYGFEPYWLISGVSGVFWLLFKLFGWTALGISSLLEETLADLFAVVYNIVLAVTYSALLYLTVTRERPGGGPAFWYLGFGFVFLYVVLGMTYSDSWSEQLDDFSLLGFAAGILSYLAFALRPELTGSKVPVLVYGAVRVLRESPVGWVFPALGTVALALFLVELIKPREHRRA